MKRRIVMMLCALSALMGAATLPALATDQYYPISVEEYTYGPFDELRVNKVYQLSLSDDPRGIPTDDFERNGRRYYLLDMIREHTTGVDTQEYTETVTMDSDTGDMTAVLKVLDAQMEVTTEDGYTGILILDHTSVKVEVKGYQTSTKNLSATRTYPGLSDADLDLIPKTVTDNGKTLTLSDVQWANDGTWYTATAKYTACLEDYAQRNGFTNVRHFTDDGVRGTTFKRPGLDAMVEEIRAGNVATVIVKDQSRIGRDVVEVGLLKRTFDEYNVRFIAANDNLDTANGFDSLTAGTPTG